jgi:hypothetical protein
MLAKPFAEVEQAALQHLVGGRDRCPARGEGRIEGRLFNFGEIVAIASQTKGVKIDRTIVCAPFQPFA